MFKVKKRLQSLLLAAVIICCSLSGEKTYAMESVSEVIEIQEYTEKIKQELPAELEQSVLENEEAMERHKALLEEGWILESVDVEGCSQSEKFGISTFGTVSKNKVKNGMVVCSRYVQPTKSKTHYDVSILSYYRDNKKIPHQSTRSFNRSYQSRKYSYSDTSLVDLARRHYNSHWIDDPIVYPKTCKLN